MIQKKLMIQRKINKIGQNYEHIQNYKNEHTKKDIQKHTKRFLKNIKIHMAS